MTAAINLLPDGSIKDSTDNRISASRIELGVYDIYGTNGIASSGWTTSIKKDHNGDNTIKLKITNQEESVKVEVFELDGVTPTDIIDCLTLRFDMPEIEWPVSP